jgi:hypothetical protein
LLPKQRELDYRGPWAISGDKKLVAASVARASDNRFVENQFLIVDALSKEVTARVERKSGAFLLTMSWSPTSRLLAVVYGQEQLGRCGSVLGSLSGHPARCTTFAIEVFDAKGSSVGAAEFARGIPGGGAVVAWQEM